MAKSNEVIVRRSLHDGERAASAYLIEGANGYRFAKCSIFDATVFKDESSAKKTLSKIRRTDPHKEDATYKIVPIS